MKNISQISRISLRDQVYQQLKQAVIHLELAPGEKISDKLLAEQFGVSRTPVREALKRLEDEGLVISSPGSETKVSLIDIEQAKHAFTVVASLNALAARLAMPFLTEAHCDELVGINQEFEKAILDENKYEAIKKDDQFHAVLLHASNNPEIEMSLERLLPKIRRLELLKFNKLDGLSSIRQHNEIIDSIRNGKQQELTKLVEDNWLSLASYLTKEET
ncbi:GntR family transcriptional regulator [Niallia taxi]|uniref:GntR family transcriptional regulator n=1 Tax=Niallia taxi TaxID=2499688 RepID=A0A437KBZ0_9BACI|nr:GntR family transcriptional regulator [Niallia taxi]MCM3217067.1 GntR family transcriptional regulator [Niallia taxi]MDK8642379.1 GntR family transcriptional regulator [Niallia taxi]MED4037277.1 GntR family transcriptional regulator [Niallia taxi]MED4054836.1 GntR family transcriptional regulator [Niallia taxi]MED4121152.1 GntR family transcriptional regulator [Niallia taxi]